MTESPGITNSHRTGRYARSKSEEADKPASRRRNKPNMNEGHRHSSPLASENEQVGASKSDRSGKKKERKRTIQRRKEEGILRDLSTPLVSSPESAQQFTVNHVTYTPQNKEELTQMNIDFLSKQIETPLYPSSTSSGRALPVTLFKEISLISKTDDSLNLENTNIKINRKIRLDKILNDLSGIFSDDEEDEFKSGQEIQTSEISKKKKKSRESSKRLERSKMRAEKFKELSDTRAHSSNDENLSRSLKDVCILNEDAIDTKIENGGRRLETEGNTNNESNRPKGNRPKRDRTPPKRIQRNVEQSPGYTEKGKPIRRKKKSPNSEKLDTHKPLKLESE